ncbi:secreted frizzled-related protein 5 [Fukomys damarensis]|uniref:secreted frizzled-related protein 5 n=1 Tax=Fukomys damarensis TaxID=885580 RepID=UPI00053F9299|nr:secreted frizzled-related protein 5 [Fukomys damarensis]
MRAAAGGARTAALALALLLGALNGAPASGEEYDYYGWQAEPLHGRFYSKPPQCLDIPADLPLCHTVGYKRMRLPNLLEHESLAEVKQQASSWLPLLAKRCHSDTQVFLCSLFAPVCLDRPIYPCRSLCEAVRSGCAPLMEAYGFPWPEMSDSPGRPRAGPGRMPPPTPQHSSASTTLRRPPYTNARSPAPPELSPAAFPPRTSRAVRAVIPRAPDIPIVLPISNPGAESLDALGGPMGTSLPKNPRPSSTFSFPGGLRVGSCQVEAAAQKRLFGLQTNYCPPHPRILSAVTKICAQCEMEHSADGLMEQMCSSDFVVKMRIKEIKVENGDRKLIGAQKKKKLLKPGPLKRKDTKRLVLHMKNGAGCPCPQLDSLAGSFLVMGRKVDGQLLLMAIYHWDKKNKEMKFAVKFMFSYPCSLYYPFFYGAAEPH